MSVSKVGLGWPVGERNYTTLADWIAAKKATGIFEEAWCKGNLGGSFATINTADFPVGALIRGDVVYDGTNHTALAHLPRRLAIVSSSGLVVAQDLSVRHTDGTQYSVTTGVGNIAQRLYIEHAGSSGVNAAHLFIQGGGIARNCVVKNTNATTDYALRTSGAGALIENCIAIGAKTAMFSLITSSTIRNSFGVAQAETIACQSYPNGLPLASNNASTDGTGGAVSILNVDKYAVFNDFDNGDYRILQSSVLGQAGIGAFFLDDGGATGENYEVAVGNTEVLLNNQIVSVTHQSIVESISNALVLENVATDLSINTPTVVSDTEVVLNSSSISIQYTAVVDVAFCSVYNENSSISAGYNYFIGSANSEIQHSNNLTEVSINNVVIINVSEILTESPVVNITIPNIDEGNVVVLIPSEQLNQNNVVNIPINYNITLNVTETTLDGGVPLTNLIGLTVKVMSTGYVVNNITPVFNITNKTSIFEIKLNKR